MSKKQNSTVFHLQFNESGAVHFFGSISAIYDTFDSATLGVSRSRLYQYNIEEFRPYSNKVITISKGRILRKPGNRKCPTEHSKQ